MVAAGTEVAVDTVADMAAVVTTVADITAADITTVDITTVGTIATTDTTIPTSTEAYYGNGYGYGYGYSYPNYYYNNGYTYPQVYVQQDSPPVVYAAPHRGDISASTSSRLLTRRGAGCKLSRSTRERPRSKPDCKSAT